MARFRRIAAALVALAFALGSPRGEEPRAATERALSDARALVRRGDFDAASKRLQDGLRDDPTSLELADALIHALVRAGRGEDAVREAQHRLRTEPENPLRWALLGDAFFGAARFEEAEQAYLGALDLGDTARAHVGLGRLHDSLSDRKTAREHFARAHELDPHDPEVAFHWLSIVEASDEGRAVIARLLAFDDRLTDDERDRLEDLAAAWDEYDRLDHPRAVFPPGSLPAVLPLLPVRAEKGQIHPENRRALEMTTGKGRKARLLLDTGAPGLLVSSSLARRLDARTFGRSKMGGFGGSETVRVRKVALDEVRFGLARVADAVVTVRHMDSNLPSTEGLVGADVFRSYLIELDMGGGVLRLHALPRREGVDDETDWEELDRPTDAIPSDAVPLRRFGSHLFVQAGIGPEKDGWMLLDSGSFQNILDLELAESLGGTKGTPLLIGGYGGTRELRTSPPFLLRVGSLRQENRDVPAVPMGDMSGRFRFRIAGLLGAPFLNHVILFVNYRDGWVRMTPRSAGSTRPTP